MDEGQVKKGSRWTREWRSIWFQDDLNLLSLLQNFWRHLQFEVQFEGFIKILKNIPDCKGCGNGVEKWIIPIHCL